MGVGLGFWLGAVGGVGVGGSLGAGGLGFGRLACLGDCLRLGLVGLLLGIGSVVGVSVVGIGVGGTRGCVGVGQVE